MNLNNIKSKEEMKLKRIEEKKRVEFLILSLNIILFFQNKYLWREKLISI